MIIQHAINRLKDIESLLGKLSNYHYSKPLAVLSSSTIGQHVRHILEFYHCLLESATFYNMINYDLRKRELKVEQDVQYALLYLVSIQNELKKINQDKSLILQSSCEFSEDGVLKVNTTLFREIYFCTDHGIHHQAMIKSALIELNLLELISDDFGVAYSTMVHRASLCVQ